MYKNIYLEQLYNEINTKMVGEFDMGAVYPNLFFPNVSDTTKFLDMFDSNESDYMIINKDGERLTIANEELTKDVIVLDVHYNVYYMNEKYNIVRKHGLYYNAVTDDVDEVSFERMQGTKYIYIDGVILTFDGDVYIPILGAGKPDTDNQILMDIRHIKYLLASLCGDIKLDEYVRMSIHVFLLTYSGFMPNDATYMILDRSSMTMLIKDECFETIKQFKLYTF